MTAVDQIDDKRIDHQGYVPETWVGLLATALYMMQVGPMIPDVSDYIEDWLALILFAGSATCLVGVVLGTKWFFPQIRRRICYIIELVGLLMIVGALAWLTYATVDAQQLIVSALAGGLGVAIEIGCVRMFVDLIDELNGD